MEIEILDPYSFEAFWDAYKKKVGIKKARKKWNELSLKDKKLAMEYIPLYIQSQPNKQYRQNPQTFINNETWNDEIINYNQPAVTNQGLIESLGKEFR